MEKGKRFRIATLGCRTNQYESQAYRSQLEALGYVEAKEGESADLCIVNTCTVTVGADKDSRQQIRRLVRENPDAQVAVTGCAIERQPEFAKSIDERVVVVSNLEKESLIGRLLPDIESLPEFEIRRFEGHTRAFVKVQDGCNSYCTYCVIPYVRGRSRSRTVAEVVQEVERLVESGYREIVLTGINIGDFDGGAVKARLADLVRAVDEIKGLERLRLSSIDPDEVDEELTGAILGGKRTCPSMHIVLQAGSNLVLKRMNRKYTRQIFIDTCERLRSLVPDFTFTTDIIVGFPGEGERDFEETLEVIAQVRFAKVHMFPYSDRPNTRASSYPMKISPERKRERKERLLRAAELGAYRLREQFLGRQMSVLTEGRMREGWITGHTANFLSVSIESNTLESNELVDVELIENRPDGLIGRLVRKEGRCKLRLLSD